MTSLYVLVVLLLSIFSQLINAQVTPTISILNVTETTTLGNETNSIPTSTIINSANTTTTSEFTVSSSTTAINESTTSNIDSAPPSKSSSKTRRWLLVAPLLTIAVVISIGIIHYYRRRTSYRGFFRNSRSRYEDTDNIIQLENPAESNSQWPSRISLA